MNNFGCTVIHFDYGGYYSDDGEDVRWNRKEAQIYTLVIKQSVEEFTYKRLVERICKKLMVDEATTMLKCSYIPLVVDPKRPSYIVDDDDVLGYLMDVNKDQWRSVLHVEPIECVGGNQSYGEFSRVDRGSEVDVIKLASDARANHDNSSMNTECALLEQHEYQELGIVLYNTNDVNMTGDVNIRDDVNMIDGVNITDDVNMIDDVTG